MSPSRNLTLIAHFILDQLLPPVLRDSRLVMAPLFYLLFGKKARYFLDFKAQLPKLSDQQINEHYALLADVFMQRETDLNRTCIHYIDQVIVGDEVLDVACGSGFLSRRLADQGKRVTSVDIKVPDERSENPVYLQGVITNLSFADNHFDTVVCTHTLEHIRDIRQAVTEIRRVCSKRLVVVVPCQREYRYTFDLHIHFFPYEHKLRELLGAAGDIKKLGGDFLYVEDMN